MEDLEGQSNRGDSDAASSFLHTLSSIVHPQSSILNPRFSETI